MCPTLSLIVPTRGRPWQLRRFLDSLVSTTQQLNRLEVLLVVDDDDAGSLAVSRRGLQVRHVVGPPGRTMGELNDAGYRAATGEYLMLLNDDVIARTRGWEQHLLKQLQRFPDGMSLIHVNDTLFRDQLCTFPVVSREFCQLAGGICPRAYRRYRIDDHIEDVFNLLAAVGVKRTIYLPDVIFEHRNTVEHPTGGCVYMSDPEILAQDAPLFESLLPARKELALRILQRIGGDVAAARERFEGFQDSFALRIPGRQVFVQRHWWQRVRLRNGGNWARHQLQRITACYRTKGLPGIVRAVGKRMRLCKQAG